MQTYKIIEMSCPSCGGGVQTDSKCCKFCGNSIVITTFSDVAAFNPLASSKYLSHYENLLKENPEDFQMIVSAGICHLKLKNYLIAQTYFEKALIENPYHIDTYFYAAICRFQGKKAFLTKKQLVDDALQLLETALSIEKRGIAYFFSAYIKYDYYKRKALNIHQTFEIDLENARNNNVTEEDKRILFELLNVESPSILL